MSRACCAQVYMLILVQYCADRLQSPVAGWKSTDRHTPGGISLDSPHVRDHTAAAPVRVLAPVPPLSTQRRLSFFIARPRGLSCCIGRLHIPPVYFCIASIICWSVGLEIFCTKLVTQ